MATSNTFTLSSFRGGLNNTDPPSSISEDQVVEAMNVEFNRSTLGERRRGAAHINLASAGITAHGIVTWLHRHLPTLDETESQLWAFAVTGTSASAMSYKDTTWHDVTMSDAFVFTNNSRFRINSQTLHGKLFIAYDSGVDRLHVWDGTSLRRVGVTQPAAPTGADTGAAGTFSGVRYYRVRYTQQVAGATVRRSEPSTSLTFTPSGTKTGVVVTKPASISEGETHWELEASKDNVLFYTLATTAVGTTTVTDTTNYTTGYAAYVLSEDIGDYTVPTSVRYLSVNQDRLVMAGSRTTAAHASRVWWTPVFNDPGQGNDERIPLDTDNYLDLNNYEGGGITALSGTINGYLYVFKRSHIYKLIRTGLRSRAYESICITMERGALEGSVVEGLDQSGNPCLYFLDPCVGPCRLGLDGLQNCSADILETWCHINLNATDVLARGLYYPESRQIWWYVANTGSNIPSIKFVLQINETRNTDAGLRRGFSFGNGPSSAAYATVLYADNIDAGVARSLKLVPHIGVAAAGTDLIWKTDIGAQDNGTAYSAYITSRPFSPVGIMNKFGIMAGTLLATAATGTSLLVTIIRDFGLETKTATALLTPVGTEAHVIKQLDNLNFSELHTLQVKLSDTVTPVDRWELNGFQLKQRSEDSA